MVGMGGIEPAGLVHPMHASYHWTTSRRLEERLEEKSNFVNPKKKERGPQARRASLLLGLV